MSLINNLYLGVFRYLIKEVETSIKNPYDYQRQWFLKLIEAGNNTAFGKEHCFNRFNLTNKEGYLKKLEYFQQNVPVRDYDAFVPYINRLRSGENYVLWNQKVKWFAKSSGTNAS